LNTPAKPSIILVEDDIRLSELVSRYLETNGFQVTVTHGGDQVVEQVQTGMPDLVILDLGLPGQDGLSICKQLRPTYPNPILILTARDNDIDHVLGLELGADDYVIKPVEPRVLMARINALLRRSKNSSGAEQKRASVGRTNATFRRAAPTRCGAFDDGRAHRGPRRARPYLVASFAASVPALKLGSRRSIRFARRELERITLTDNAFSPRRASLPATKAHAKRSSSLRTCALIATLGCAALAH
jgi:CheY-like chemotaxis protein